MQTDPGRPATHLADDRRLGRHQQFDQPVCFGGQPPLDAPDPGARVPCIAANNVEAGTEVVTSCSQEHDPDRFVGTRRGQRGEHRLDDRVGKRVALGWSIDLELENRPDLLDSQPLDRPVGTRDLAVAHPPRYLSLIACSASCRFWAPPGGSGNCTGPRSRLGSRMVAWPGVVNSPRWFVVVSSTSTAGRPPAARYRSVTDPES